VLLFFFDSREFAIAILFEHNSGVQHLFGTHLCLSLSGMPIYFLGKRNTFSAPSFLLCLHSMLGLSVIPGCFLILHKHIFLKKFYTLKTIFANVATVTTGTTSTTCTRRTKR
jgi:hypothetical protein